MNRQNEDERRRLDVMTRLFGDKARSDNTRLVLNNNPQIVNRIVDDPMPTAAQLPLAHRGILFAAMNLNVPRGAFTRLQDLKIDAAISLLRRRYGHADIAEVDENPSWFDVHEDVVGTANAVTEVNGFSWWNNPQRGILVSLDLRTMASVLLSDPVLSEHWIDTFSRAGSFYCAGLRRGTSHQLAVQQEQQAPNQQQIEEDEDAVAMAPNVGARVGFSLKKTGEEDAKHMAQKYGGFYLSPMFPMFDITNAANDHVARQPQNWRGGLHCDVAGFFIYRQIYLDGEWHALPDEVAALIRRYVRELVKHLSDKHACATFLNKSDLTWRQLACLCAQDNGLPRFALICLNGIHIPIRNFMQANLRELSELSAEDYAHPLALAELQMKNLAYAAWMSLSNEQWDHAKHSALSKKVREHSFLTLLSKAKLSTMEDEMFENVCTLDRCDKCGSPEHYTEGCPNASRFSEAALAIIKKNHGDTFGIIPRSIMAANRAGDAKQKGKGRGNNQQQHQRNANKKGKKAAVKNTAGKQTEE